MKGGKGKGGFDAEVFEVLVGKEACLLLFIEACPTTVGCGGLKERAVVVLTDTVGGCETCSEEGEGDVGGCERWVTECIGSSNAGVFGA